jgi:hypothetical protein
MNGHSQDDDTCDTAKPRSISLCRFEPDLAPIALQPTSTIVVACDRLEDALDDPLDPTIEFPVEYPQQDDALLLHCRLPQPAKTLLQQASPNSREGKQLEPHVKEDPIMASITGLPEQFPGGGHHHPMVKMKIFNASLSSRSPDDTSCKCQVPHHSWERKPIDAFPNKNDTQGKSASTVNMLWVDLRSCAASATLFPNLSSVAHFFRSLFGTSHAASPWCPPEEGYNHPNKPTKMPDRVALLFAHDAPENLHNVRVGDICPSWSLYSIARLQIPSRWCPWESSTVDIAPLLRATLVIFKQLPPRPLLSLSPPARVPMDEATYNLVQLPKGCLWETYFTYQEEEEHIIDDEKKQSSSTEKKAIRLPRCRMTSPPYISYSEEYIPSLWKPLLEHWKIIQQEALRIPQWTAWPETQHYSKVKTKNNGDDDSDNDDPDSFHPSWTVFPLCHCFPANIIENRQWVHKTCAFVPQTVQLLQRHLGPVLRTALFSRLDPETTLEAHTGWADLANHVIRCHLPLVVPPGGVCGTWVDGCIETHEEGRLLCFDDSKVHRAFNYSKGERIVLILDLARPNNLPLGTATGGHSDELDQFIAQMNI